MFWVVIAIMGLMILIWGGWFVLRPEVVLVEPPDGERIGPGEVIRVEFSRNINSQSVEENLQFELDIPVELTWDGSALSIRPAERWPGGTQFSITLNRGARSRLGIGLGERSWSYVVEAAQVVYLAPSTGPSNLVMLDLNTGEATQLTDITDGILDYSIDPQGMGIYFCNGHQQGEGGVMYWERSTGRVQTIIDLQVPCTHIEVSPGGDYLAYGTLPVGSVSLLRLHEESVPEPVPVALAFDFAWRNADSLSLLSTVEETLWLYEVDTMRLNGIPSISQEIGSWSPDGDSYIATELIEITTQFVPQGFASHIVSYSVADEAWGDLTPEPALEDHEPVFSPDGERIVFSRKSLDEDEWTLGRQLWWMRADGSAAEELTDLPDILHNSMSWSPEGSRVTFLRFNQQSMTDPPELWMIDLDTQVQLQLATGAYEPGWLP